MADAPTWYPPRKTRIAIISAIGVIALAGVIGYAAYAKGVFKAKEKIAILTWTQDTFWVPTEQGAIDAAKETGVELTFVKSEPNIAAQNEHLKALIDAGNVAVAISPNDAVAQEAVINDAAAKAVVLTFDTDAPASKRKGFVGTDDYAAGQVAAGEVRTAIPDGGKVIISVGDTDKTNGRDRRQGIIDDLLDRGFKRDSAIDPPTATLKGKTYEIVATVTDGHDAAKATQLLVDAIKANPDAKCIVGLFSYSGPAAVKAVEQAGKKGRIKIVGFDEDAEEQAAVAAGAIYSSVLQAQYRCGYETVRVMVDMLRGTQQAGPTGPHMTALPVAVMRADNIDMLRASRVIRDPAAK